MSEDARASVLRQINRKIKQANEAKYRHTIPYISKVYEFFKSVESIYKTAANNGEFQYLISLEGASLMEKLRLIDPDVAFRMEWNDVEDWTTLRLQGVTITWSPAMLAQNPEMSKTEYIDVVEMLIN